MAAEPSEHADSNPEPGREGPGNASGPLCASEVESLLESLTEEITNYDCGDLCRPDNNGVAYCCSVEHALPSLHRAELEYLNRGEAFWQRWSPTSDAGRELARELPEDQILCECPAGATCQRSRRSLSCRTFPMEPYFGQEEDEMIGLTFMREFTWRDPATNKPRCPLSARQADIRQSYIDQAFDFWARLMARLPQERKLYRRTSAQLRADFERTGRRFHVLRPSSRKPGLTSSSR